MEQQGNMEPTPKSEGIEQLLTAITGKDRGETIRARKCATCDAVDVEFRDGLSAREYAISGMCQVCQDEIFGMRDDADSWP